jgi:hypothetical protein
VFVGGCGDGGEIEENVEKASSAITWSPVYTDATGKIRVQVKSCDPTASAATNCAYCSADANWARIGGGAEIIGENTPGAMLQASFPSPNSFPSVNSYGCTGAGGSTRFDATWVVRASGASHQLRAYVIQLPLVGNNGVAFMPSVTEGIDNVTDEVNPPGTYTVESLESNVRGGDYFLVGGGAYIFTSNPANDITARTDAYLVESRPVDGPNGRAWRATARAQHNVVLNEPLKSYAIGIEKCPSQWGGSCLTQPAIREAMVGATTGYGTATYTLPSSFVGSSVGGYAPSSNGNARFLADLIPFTGGGTTLTVRSKSDGTGGSGATYASTLILGTTAGLYAYNTIYSAGVGIFNRGSGSNPPLQMSFTASSNIPATRWHFESLGSGTYRLRNGNPGSGTECAYRDGSTSNVKVKACGTTNDFKWTFVGDPIAGGFQVKNVTNNQCIDFGGPGSGGTTNLLLKPCGAWPQSFWLSSWGWP